MLHHTRQIALHLTVFALTGSLLAADVARNEQAIADVQAGKLEEARASWWGFSTEDSTRALQAAIHSAARRLVVDKQAGPWIVDELQLRSDLEILFEPGVEVLAKKGAFRGSSDALFSAWDCQNVRLLGRGLARAFRSAHERRARGSLPGIARHTRPPGIHSRKPVAPPAVDVLAARETKSLATAPIHRVGESCVAADCTDQCRTRQTGNAATSCRAPSLEMAVWEMSSSRSSLNVARTGIESSVTPWFMARMSVRSEPSSASLARPASLIPEPSRSRCVNRGSAVTASNPESPTSV